MKKQKSISVSPDTHYALYEVGRYGESMDDLIIRLIRDHKEHENCKKASSKQVTKGHKDKEKKIEAAILA